MTPLRLHPCGIHEPLSSQVLVPLPGERRQILDQSGSHHHLPCVVGEHGFVVDANDVMLPVGAEIIHGVDGSLSPGFVDIHRHGGAGSDFMDGTPDAVRMANSPRTPRHDNHFSGYHHGGRRHNFPPSLSTPTPGGP